MKTLDTVISVHAVFWLMQLVVIPRKYALASVGMFWCDAGRSNATTAVRGCNRRQILRVPIGRILEKWIPSRPSSFITS